MMAQEHDPAPLAAPAEKQNVARISGIPWILFILALTLAAWLAYQAYAPEDKGSPLGTTLTAFEKQNSLTVFSAQLAPVVAAEDSRLLGLVTSKQVAIIPARVDYTLDLSQMDQSRLDWDETTQTLTVRLPAIKAGKPNLDEARAQYLREGIWISRDAQDNLSRKNTQLAEKLALEQAVNPVLMGLAQSAAKDAVRQNLVIPLQVAGFPNVKVDVLLDGDQTTKK